MIKSGQTTVQDPVAVQKLQGVLLEECRHYEELLTLAHDQGCLMTTHDLDGLEENARQMTVGLAAADAVRIRRERLASELMSRSGAAVPGSLSAWLEGQDPALGAQLTGPVQAVRRAAGELARANEMNRRLASFCLDLVEEEAALLRRCLLEDPAGCYDKGAHPTSNERSGVLVRQA
jgi:hypothetical protein